MAHPKRKISKQRRNKRRSHLSLKPAAIAVCDVTGESHLWHRAYWSEGKMYYKGKVVLEKEIVEEEE